MMILPSSPVTHVFLVSSCPQTREDIIASRDKRREQLERVLENTREKVDGHYAGNKILKQHVLDQMEKKIRAYDHQVEELSRELDEDVRAE
jgi:predicted RNase H-like nuclease (RuvC/YqgF family)